MIWGRSWHTTWMCQPPWPLVETRPRFSTAWVPNSGWRMLTAKRRQQTVQASKRPSRGNVLFASWLTLPSFRLLVQFHRLRNLILRAPRSWSFSPAHQELVSWKQGCWCAAVLIEREPGGTSSWRWSSHLSTSSAFSPHGPCCLGTSYSKGCGMSWVLAQEKLDE